MAELAPGEVAGFRIDGVAETVVVACRVGHQLFAYRDHCPVCDDSLAGAELDGALLRCPRCREAVPVRKRLLLVLPEGDKFEYVCTRCSATCGIKIERPPPATFLIVANPSVGLKTCPARAALFRWAR